MKVIKTQRLLQQFVAYADTRRYLILMLGIYMIYIVTYLQFFSWRRLQKIFKNQ